MSSLSVLMGSARVRWNGHQFDVFVWEETRRGKGKAGVPARRSPPNAVRRQNEVLLGVLKLFKRIRSDLQTRIPEV